MDDIKSIVIRNEYNLPEDQVKRLINTLYQKGISYLSPDKEEGPFLLYAMGNDFETIALKSNYPIDVIYLTAMRYDWKNKITLLSKIKDLTPQEIQRDLANTLLMATWISIQRELGEVISGKIEANRSKLIPKSTKALNELIDMVNKVNGIGEQNPAPISVNAQNVQINTHSGNDQEHIDKIELLKRISREQ